jgi:hypothetical protein
MAEAGMSVSAQYLRILVDGGRTTDDMILVARAMERGPDRDEMFDLVEPLVKAGVANKTIADAMCDLARNLVEYQRTPWRGQGTGAPDPYKERLGISKGAWARLREVVFDRDGTECRYCGDEANTVDHVVPLSRGGTNDLSNLTPACKPCNSSKRDRLVEEWLGVAE